MDVERTMEFILEMQAKAEVRMAKHDERMAKVDARMDRVDARMDRVDARMDRVDARMEKFDKRLEATRKLIEGGMKFIIKHNREFARGMKELKEAQQRTDRKLDRLIDSWGAQRTNGHKN